MAAAQVSIGLSDTAERDLYIAEPDAEPIVTQYRLRPDLNGQVRLHVIPASVPPELLPTRAEQLPAAAAAADLLDEDDPRSRRAAQVQLRAMLKALLADHRIRPSSKSGAGAPDDELDEARGPSRTS